MVHGCRAGVVLGTGAVVWWCGGHVVLVCRLVVIEFVVWNILPNPLPLCCPYPKCVVVW